MKKINPYQITINQDLAVRLIICLIALVNAVSDMLGGPHLEIGPEQVTTCVNAAFLIGTFAWGFWKDNPFTAAAKEGNEVTKILKEDPEAVVQASLK